MKKTVGFRFATGTLEKLDALSEGTTRTAVLERLIEDAFEGPTFTQPVAPTVEDLMTSEPLVPAATAKRQIDTPAAAKQAVSPPTRRKINPMTGKPFGPVPK